MSRNVAIRTDGSNRRFINVKTLTVKDSHEQADGWMPANDLVLGEITVTENGEYVPADIGAYAYYKVNVLVAGGDGAMMEVTEGGKTSYQYVEPLPAGMGSGTGGQLLGLRSDGNYYYSKVDADGNLTSVKVPSEARLRHDPYKTKYDHGDTIDYSGTVIGLYYRDGTLATSYADNGLVIKGSTHWSRYVVEDSSALSAANGSTQYAKVYVRPFWLDDGLRLSLDYALACSITVFVL